MVEFMKLVEVKERAARAASGEPELLTEEEGRDLVEGLRARGIIDDKGLVRHGR